MKKIVFISFLFAALTANALTLSDSCRMSLLTCSPSSEIYARFGHTAIRICDPANDIDYAYNYGIFDFDTDWFIPRFIHGATDYQLGVTEMDYFLRSYAARKSSVFEQVLNLNQSEKQALFDALEINYLPQNRVYRYNFVYDNCATRPFVMITKVLENQPIISYSHPTTSYRGIINEFVGLNNWQRFGIDILIGREADLPIHTAALIAFPKYTSVIMGSITLENDIVSEPLASESQALCYFPPILPSEKSIFSPIIICCLIILFITFLSYWAWKNQRELILLDFLLFFMSGALGCVIFYLMFISSHPLVHQNYNLLWLNPLNLIFAFLILKESWRNPLKYYAILNAFAALIAIIIFATRYQIMHPAFLPLIAIMLMRSALFFQRK
ncbi:MAG: DUF4105 domain-containing protein [Prevotellaceae bacterium]|jgi:hypothetical protein|nr:DUF4105 domain-containing protein [Prevotellaceae bacterium]